MAQGLRKRVAIGLALVLVYFLAGKFGLKFASVNPSATALWPPTGIALFGFLVFGYGVWPAIFLGAFWVNLTTQGTIPTSIGIALGNTLEGLAGAYLVNKFANGRKAFDRYQDVFKFAFLAAAGSTIVSATFGVTTLSLAGLARWEDFKSIWLTWWFGDAGGDLIVAPLLILWSAGRQIPRALGQILERALMITSTLLVGAIAFGLVPTVQFPLAFLSFPVLAWSAFRFAQNEAATGIFILSGLATWGTLRGYGQFGQYPPEKSLLVLQAFLGTVAVTNLAISAVVLQHKRDEEALRAARDELERRVSERTKELFQANASLRELSGRLLEAQDKERRRLARELHESTAQTLAVLKMNLEVANETSGARESAQTKVFASALKLTEQALEEIRTLAYLLYPPSLENAGLTYTIPSYAEGFARRSGVKVAVEVPSGLGRLPSDVEIALFHVVQESLTNIHRHAESPRARIKLEVNTTELTLEIQDEGRGISQDELGRKEALGVGIRGMRQTIELLGGRLEIGSRSPGTFVRAVIPISGRR